MKDQPQRDPKILEAIEACRPHGDDLADPVMAPAAAELAADPELHDLFERLQRFDVGVARAFHDVTVPDRLADRILGRLAEACPERETPHPTDRPQPAALAEPVAAAGAAPEPPVSRRWLVVGIGGIVAATLMLTAVVIHVQRPDYDKPAMLEVAMQFFEHDRTAGGAGQPIGAARPQNDYPLSPDVAQGAWVRWRSISGFLGRRGVAYEIARPGRPRATLYVVKYPPVGLPSRPFQAPSLTTRNLSASAWQSGPLLYVLVVDGGSRTYRAFLNLPRGPLT